LLPLRKQHPGYFTMPPVRTNTVSSTIRPVKTERTHEENQERYVAIRAQCMRIEANAGV
jgi:hypothetical protein